MTVANFYLLSLFSGIAAFLVAVFTVSVVLIVGMPFGGPIGPSALTNLFAVTFIATLAIHGLLLHRYQQRVLRQMAAYRIAMRLIQPMLLGTGLWIYSRLKSRLRPKSRN